MKSNQSDLEKEIAAFSKKQVNREKYEFKDIIPGSVVMILKPLHCDEALPKHICPHCTTDFVISPLQLRRQGSGEWLNCHKYHLEIV
ncbi:hypothetical protein [Candidatus Regiella endosymbiont of Tuberolachnus salignus]|uniref:hypothetical protein n=1 Tax=Candidatus Regiella endosymbiont of Tuberolachnus salignus TaxID=3077956 RepID=UPI0030D55486